MSEVEQVEEFGDGYEYGDEVRQRDSACKRKPHLTPAGSQSIQLQLDCQSRGGFFY